jgi:hypothetical protein
MTSPADLELQQRYLQISRALTAAFWALHRDGLIDGDDLRQLYKAAVELRPHDQPASRRRLRQIIRSEAHLAASPLDLVRHRWATELAGDEDRQVAVFLLNRLCGHRGALAHPSARLHDALRSLTLPT